MSGFDPETLAFYAKEAPVYTAGGAGGISRHLADFANRLAPGARILELGCGGGVDAEYLIGRGFDVEATDGVAEIATQAARRLGQTVRVMRFDELDADASYDAIVASASLLHVPRIDLVSVLGRVRRALRPEGWHLGTYKGGGQEGRDRFGRYFNYLAVDEARRLYEDTGPWQKIEVAEGLGGGYDGVQGPWVRVIARR